MENNINNQIKELNQLDGKLLILQRIILKNFIDKTTNNIIRQYLEEMLDNHIYISFVSDFLKDFEKQHIYKLDIGSKVPKNFDKELSYDYISGYGKYTVYELTFEVDNNNIITNITYNIE
jgi:hypothetical protein